MKIWWQKLVRSDWLLSAAVFVLVVFSLVILFSLDDSPGKNSFFTKQLIAFFAGLLGYLFLIKKNYKIWQHYGWLSYLVSILLLLGVLFFGQEIRNIKAWFIIGPISIQPVEFVKVLFIVFLARFLTSLGSLQQLLKTIFLSGLLTGLLMFLIVKQPDFGSAMILFFIFLIAIFFMPLRRWHYFLIILVISLGAIASWNFYLQDYQRTRILTFLNTEADPLAEGYNITQAKVAVGSGGIWGRGLGFGTQSQLNFLPEAHSDFIFAVIAENFGFFGSLLFLAVYLFFFYRLTRILQLARTDFGKYITLGVMVYLFFQLMINIGMNIGLVPVAGVPLPLVSAGGSSLVSVLLALGLVQSVYIHDR
jgi:rod shape determining protein RodA